MKRNVNGVLLLDKPINMTSNEVLQLVKKLFGANKAGHTGSLDPIATGMLPVCFGETTKFSQFLLETDKHYIVTGKLGETTSSEDSETAVIKKREINNITANTIWQVLPKFLGKISQLPPMYSAIKHKGQPLYKLARQGIDVERKTRKITVHAIKLLELDKDLATFEIRCSKGTYVRTIIANIGDVLGCGAHVVSLRRLGVGKYLASQMITLAKLQEISTKNDYKVLDSFLLPVESMLTEIPELILTTDMAYYMRLGQALLIPNVPPGSSWVKLKSKNGVFLGVGEVMDDGKVAPRKMLCYTK